MIARAEPVTTIARNHAGRIESRGSGVFILKPILMEDNTIDVDGVKALMLQFADPENQRIKQRRHLVVDAEGIDLSETSPVTSRFLKALEDAQIQNAHCLPDVNYGRRADGLYVAGMGRDALEALIHKKQKEFERSRRELSPNDIITNMTTDPAIPFVGYIKEQIGVLGKAWPKITEYGAKADHIYILKPVTTIDDVAIRAIKDQVIETTYDNRDNRFDLIMDMEGINLPKGEESTQQFMSALNSIQKQVLFHRNMKREKNEKLSELYIAGVGNKATRESFSTYAGLRTGEIQRSHDDAGVPPLYQEDHERAVGLYELNAWSEIATEVAKKVRQGLTGPRMSSEQAADIAEHEAWKNYKQEAAGRGEKVVHKSHTDWLTATRQKPDTERFPKY